MLEGTLTGQSTPLGLCSDSNSNVYVVENGSSTVVEYAHGGTEPIAVFGHVSNSYPVDCSVSPTTGFVDGANASSVFGLAELPYSSGTMTPIVLKQSITTPGGVQWHGKDLAVADAANSVIYRFALSGTTGTKKGSTFLSGPYSVAQFWIQGSRLIGPDAGEDEVGIWQFPAGGSPIKVLADDQPFGATVSATAGSSMTSPLLSGRRTLRPTKSGATWSWAP